VDPIAAAEGADDQVIRSLCDTRFALPTQIVDLALTVLPRTEGKLSGEYEDRGGPPNPWRRSIEGKLRGGVSSSDYSGFAADQRVQELREIETLRLVNRSIANARSRRWYNALIGQYS
jgi:hypothetical protein